MHTENTKEGEDILRMFFFKIGPASREKAPPENRVVSRIAGPPTKSKNSMMVPKMGCLIEPCLHHLGGCNLSTFMI